MLISHDLRVIGKLADRVLIMQDGNIVETMTLTEESRKAAKDKPKRHDKTADKDLSEYENDNEMLRFDTPKTEYGKKLLSAAF